MTVSARVPTHLPLKFLTKYGWLLILDGSSLVVLCCTAGWKWTHTQSCFLLFFAFTTIAKKLHTAVNTSLHEGTGLDDFTQLYCQEMEVFWLPGPYGRGSWVWEQGDNVRATSEKPSSELREYMTFFFFKVLRNSGELYAIGFYVTPGTCGARYLIGPQIYTEATKGRSFKAITQLLNYLSQRRKKGATGGGMAWFLREW